MNERRIIEPEGWARPRGYANGIAARGELLAVAGQIGWNAQQHFESDELLPQFRQALANVVAVLRAAGGGPEHMISMTMYVVDKHAYLAAAAEIGGVWRELCGKNFPTMALVQVAALLEDRALVELQALAVLPVSEESPR
ncbi:MAG: RidA family protein [Deltaproteobacteria bacterium]|nr:RidA family protein [Nannocystaceae bacterium]